jgi:hypothetical protein
MWWVLSAMVAWHRVLTRLTRHLKIFDPSELQGYQVLLDTWVSLRSSRAQCPSAVRHMAWQLNMWSREILRFWTLNESCVPPNLLLTKCLNYKMLQSSSPVIWSLSQLMWYDMRHAHRLESWCMIRVVMRDQSQDIRSELWRRSESESVTGVGIYDQCLTCNRSCAYDQSRDIPIL